MNRAAITMWVSTETGERVVDITRPGRKTRRYGNVTKASANRINDLHNFWEDASTYTRPFYAHNTIGWRAIWKERGQ